MTLHDEGVVDRAVALARVLAVGDARAGAELAVAATPAEEVKFLAISFLAEQVRAQMRAETLAKERAAGRAQAATPAQRQAARQAAAAAQEEREHERLNGLWRVLTPVVERFQREMRMEWTDELLAAGIALPDGTTTTWGEATIEQHEQRRVMFLQNAVANTEGAARHAKAIAALHASHCNTLREMVAQ